MKPDRASAKGRLLLAAIRLGIARRTESGVMRAEEELHDAALEYERQMTPAVVGYVRKRWGKR